MAALFFSLLPLIRGLRTSRGLSIAQTLRRVTPFAKPRTSSLSMLNDDTFFGIPSLSRSAHGKTVNFSRGAPTFCGLVKLQSETRAGMI